MTPMHNAKHNATIILAHEMALPNLAYEITLSIGVTMLNENAIF